MYTYSWNCFISGAPRHRDYCLNGGVCFQLNTVMRKACECRYGFAGLRCQLQSPILTRSAFNPDDSTVDGALEEHGFVHTPVQRRSPTMEVVMGPIGSSSAKTAFEDENGMNRATQAKYGFLESLMKRDHPTTGSEESSALSYNGQDEPSDDNSKRSGSQLLLSILSRKIRTKQQQLQNKTKRLENILGQSPFR